MAISAKDHFGCGWKRTRIQLAAILSVICHIIISELTTPLTVNIIFVPASLYAVLGDSEVEAMTAF